MCEIEEQTKFYNSKAEKTGWRDFIGSDFINLPSCQAAQLPNFLAFTMAEILISLTIIGVIAAITLPSLRANINEKTWATQRKALYSRMSQAISLMPSINGYGIGATDAETAGKAAESFITNGLAKVLKINNICDYDHFKDCGVPKSFTNLTGSSKYDFPTTLSELNTAFSQSDYLNNTKTINTDAAAFLTPNGESIVVYYNPICIEDFHKPRVFINAFMCANFIYDLNGQKGPNKVGKDIGVMTAFSPTDSVLVAPVPLTKNAKQRHENGNAGRADEASKYCRLQDKDSRVPSVEELMSMAYNMKLFSMFSNGEQYWSSYKIPKYMNNNDYYIGQQLYSSRLYRDYFVYYSSFNLRCIKK